MHDHGKFYNHLFFSSRHGDRDLGHLCLTIYVVSWKTKIIWPRMFFWPFHIKLLLPGDQNKESKFLLVQLWIEQLDQCPPPCRFWQLRHESPQNNPCQEQSKKNMNKIRLKPRIRILLKFRFSKKATKFETISQIIWCLLSKCQITWEIVPNFCGLFRMSEL